MARRGFFAELQHQSQVAARNRERAQRIAIQQHNAAVREAERARKASMFAAKKLANTNAAERKRLEKEAHEAHIASMEAEAEEKNGALADCYEELDTLLTSSLNRDSYVELKTLRSVAEHAPFQHPELEKEIPMPELIPDPSRPTYIAPEPPTGFRSLFSKEEKFAEAVEMAQKSHASDLVEWQKKCEEALARRTSVSAARDRAESARLAALTSARSQYAEDCKKREADVAARNRHLDELIANLGYGIADAVQEYISIVLEHSEYPELYPVSFDVRFEPASGELTCRFLIPNPGGIPEVKTYKYSKATDEILTVALPPKACRDRYESSVHQVTLRAIHEIFQADRRGVIRTVKMEVGTEAIHPATGQSTYIPFVVVGAEREMFLKLNLSAVIPSRTLGLLNASVSKNPYGLVATELLGVRKS